MNPEPVNGYVLPISQCYLWLQPELSVMIAHFVLSCQPEIHVAPISIPVSFFPHFGANIKKLKNFIPDTWRYRGVAIILWNRWWRKGRFVWLQLLIKAVIIARNNTAPCLYTDNQWKPLAAFPKQAKVLTYISSAPYFSCNEPVFLWSYFCLDFAQGDI